MRRDTSRHDYCCRCGDLLLKSRMAKLSIQSGSCGSPKKLAYLCRDCVADIGDYLGVSVPDYDLTVHRVCKVTYQHEGQNLS